MSDRISLSVVCPCFNEEANLPLLAERLFAATYEAGIETELIVVDDASTDATPDVVNDLKLDHGDAVRCVRHDRNLGIAAAWRSGLDAAAVRMSASSTATSRTRPKRLSRCTTR